jgi:hypothetical protein
LAVRWRMAQLGTTKYPWLAMLLNLVFRLNSTPSKLFIYWFHGQDWS